MSVCGIILFGTDYIRKKIDNVKQWQAMNPEIRFIIITTLLSDTREERDMIEEIIAGQFEIVYIDEPMVNWYKHRLQELSLPIHYVSDIIRWFGLDKIKDKGEPVFLIEGDTICKKPHWMIEYIEELPRIDEPQPLEELTIFGPDRACIVYSHRSPTHVLEHILYTYRNVYTYLIQQNIFVGNFEHFMVEPDVERILLSNWHYASLIALPLQSRSTKADLRRFIDEIPASMLGIGIFQYRFNIDRPYKRIELYDAERNGDYTHEAKKEWMKGGKTRRKKKRKKTHKKYAI